MDKDELVGYYLEAISVDINRVANALEVISGARTINSIVKLPNGNKAQFIYGNNPQELVDLHDENRYFLYSRKLRKRIDCGAPCWYTQFKSVENGFQCHKCLKFYPLEEYYC